jgi:hypothetical protein
MSDTLSRQHLKAVRTEIEGRFFSPEEADELKKAIDDRTFTNPTMRKAAAACWPESGGDRCSKTTSSH